MPIAAALIATALTWFGPVQVSFEAGFAGNPYDYRTNDVRVTFVAADGHQEERLAYFEDGRWKAWLATTHPADYVATLSHNGALTGATPVDVTVREAVRMSGGYIGLDDGRFVVDAGKPYFPLGHNLGWQQDEGPTLVTQLGAMGRAGMNWTRIWACAFDEKNPFYSRVTPPPPPGELLPAPLKRWERLITAAEEAGVRLQLVLFHHGLFSTEVNPNWNEHPWNAANGGFLARPQDFFTDPTARDYSKRWLREAVARWAHSPAIMSWELFNEVEWTDLVRKDHDWATVAAWHADMATFLRSIDPYHHLITTSSATEYPALYDAMDYAQPHIYTRNLTVGIGGANPPLAKPWFFGEFGGNTHGPAAADERNLVRDGLWASVLAGQPGAAGYWYWDRVAQQHLEPEFTHMGRALKLSGLPAHPAARALALELAGTSPAPLLFSPGRGWGPTKVHRYQLPDDATPRKLAELSSYLHGPDQKHPNVEVPPLELHFTAPADGTATIHLIAAAPKGAGLQVMLDGLEVSAPTWPATEPGADGQRHERSDLAPIMVRYPSGPHVLELRSTGPDWVSFSNIVLPDLGQTSHAMAIGDANLMLARVTTEADHVPATIDLHGTGLDDGSHLLRIMDLDTGAETRGSVEIAGGTITGLHLPASDVAVIVTSR